MILSKFVIMMSAFHQVSQDCSKLVTKSYSTSFFSAIRLLHKDLRRPICDIYGMVRFADEIVDTFHDYPKETLLGEFRRETCLSIERGISLNPILHSFQRTVNEYAIDPELIAHFFDSMKMDLAQTAYAAADYQQYIYGSAEVVGLMCLQVFCEGKDEVYQKLKPYAQSLGAAFQKVNFLRDIKADFTGLNRMYFPGIDFDNFKAQQKREIEEDIEHDFQHAFKGILQLPIKARFGVYVAYKYYFSLFRKIRTLKPERVMQARIRIPSYHKLAIVLRAGMKNNCPFYSLKRGIT